MTKSQYRALMEDLDAAVSNGYDDEMESMTPEEIYADILATTGARTWEDVSEAEIHKAIRGWQERTFGEGDF